MTDDTFAASSAFPAASRFDLVLLYYKMDTSFLIFLAFDRGEQYVEDDEASPAGLFTPVGAPAKLSG